MMKKTRILDCTLRDGGRVIDCMFEDSTTKNIADKLTDSGIEIIELGFLRSNKLVDYRGNSTFFTNIEQMDFAVSDIQRSMYTTFIDYNMFEFETLIEYRGKGVEGIRVGFTKKQYLEECQNIVKAMKTVKEKGYKLFIQSVNTPGYSDKELLEIVEIVNEIKPCSFGIVDTYGSLYLEDMTHIFDLIEHNLDKEICIDIHSHNNMQSSFAFAQEIIRVTPEDRNIILDTTLNGMGKCAGNLNTELIVDYLNRKKAANYDLDRILDIIDIYLSPIKERNEWGYSIPAFMAGIYKSHPNNILYLTDKYRLKSKDIKYIISGISEDKRQRYDYDNIARVYSDYQSSVIDDNESIQYLKKKLEHQNVVILAPGKSVIDYTENIRKIVEENKAFVISINFVPGQMDYDFVFCANPIHWERLNSELINEKCILTSNIHENTEDVLLVNYSTYIEEDSPLQDNSVIMLLNLLKRISVNNVFIAGFDGIRDNAENYVDAGFLNSGHGMSVKNGNEIIGGLYKRIKKRYKEEMNIYLITPSLYSEEVYKG